MINTGRIIEIFKETDVLRHGHFLLTSGRHSDSYMQCAKLLRYPNYTEEIIKGLAEEFKQDKIDIVIGPAIGGIIISYEFARQLNAISYFAERENNIMTLRRGFTIPRGARVLVVEDVITTGGSVKEVINIVEEQGGIVVGVSVLADRTDGKIDFGKKLISAFSSKISSYTADECPLCKEENLPLEKPGSKNLTVSII